MQTRSASSPGAFPWPGAYLLDIYRQKWSTPLQGSSGQKYWRASTAHGITSETILKPSFIDCGMTGVKLVGPDEEVARAMCLSFWLWFYGVCV